MPTSTAAARQQPELPHQRRAATRRRMAAARPRRRAATSLRWRREHEGGIGDDGDGSAQAEAASGAFDNDETPTASAAFDSGGVSCSSAALQHAQRSSPATGRHMVQTCAAVGTEMLQAAVLAPPLADAAVAVAGKKGVPLSPRAVRAVKRGAQAHLHQQSDHQEVRPAYPQRGWMAAILWHELALAELTEAPPGTAPASPATPIRQVHKFVRNR